MRILFVEPPKDLWFVMGDYLPPPLGILELASYLESRDKSLEIDVLDAQAERLDWEKLEKYIESYNPDIIAPSSLATCNAFVAVRTLEAAKKANPDVVGILGGQHFTATAQESLENFPEIDIVVRGEGEQTLAELVQALENKEPLSNVKGISFRHSGSIVHTPPRPLLANLDELPFPGYHFVEKHMSKYHFRMMVNIKERYALIEGSRGCPHRCTFCSQSAFWEGRWRMKSPRRIADEMEYCYTELGSRFLWLTDDNFGLGDRADQLCDEIKRRGIANDIMWFVQARCDDIINHRNQLPKLREAGALWMLVGIESNNPETIKTFQKGISPSQAKQAMDLLKKNDIFAQATFIIGERKDDHESIRELREFANLIDPDLAIFMALTPFPGTELYETSKRNAWIEDTNWANYDMAHAIMPTEKLSRLEVQEELYECYRSFYGSFPRQIKAVFSPNAIKRKTYRYLASQDLLGSLKRLF